MSAIASRDDDDDDADDDDADDDDDDDVGHADYDDDHADDVEDDEDEDDDDVDCPDPCVLGVFQHWLVTIMMTMVMPVLVVALVMIFLTSHWIYKPLFGVSRWGHSLYNIMENDKTFNEPPTNYRAQRNREFSVRKLPKHYSA